MIESPPPGQNYTKYETWKTLNRLRAGVARNKKNLVKWEKKRYFSSLIHDFYECGSV